MDTAGKAVLFSGVTVLISLSAVMLVPSPAFRSTSLGIMLSVVFVLAAALTLLPAALAKLGPRVTGSRFRGSTRGEHHSPRSAAWAERLWRQPLRYGLAALALLVVLALPVLSLKTAMPSIKVVPAGDSSRQGYDAMARRRSGRVRTGPAADRRSQGAGGAGGDGGAARSGHRARHGRRCRAQGGMALVQAIPTTDPSANADRA
jgi:RND superfamily putative drug exporter